MNRRTAAASKPDPRGVEARLRAAAARAGLVRPGETVLAACSGGPDSMALLHLLAGLRRDIPFALAVAHFNHRLRSGADADEAFVKKEARRLGLRCLTGRRDVRAYARRRGLNLEEAARLLRYEFLARAAARCGASRIATGHTMNDQAETVLMRILRGTGPAGLAGIAPETEGLVIRPLLGLTRRETEAYCRDLGIPFRIDPTNRDTRLFRNRVRLELIPFLERRFQPAAVPLLARLAEIAASEEGLLRAAVRRNAARLISGRGEARRLDGRGLDGLGAAEARRVVREFLAGLRGDLRGVSFEDVEAVRAMREGGLLTLDGALRLERRRGSIGLPEKRRPAARYAYEWTGRSALRVPEAGLEFSGRFESSSRRTGARAGDDEAGCRIDAGRLRFPLTVRSRRPGDRYRPLGAPGTKKLKEIMRAKGIPEEERSRCPVVLSGREIVWVYGLPVAESWKLAPATKKIFRIVVSKRDA